MALLLLCISLPNIWECGDFVVYDSYMDISTKEIWREIAGYEGLYEISNMGRVKSMNYKHTGKAKVLKLTPNNKGYLMVGLHKNGKSKTCRVHRLVAQAFIPNPDNLPQVNHKNEIKTDNRAENLEMCTLQYNHEYGSHNKKVAEAQHKISVSQYEKVSEIFLNIYASAYDAQRATGVAQNSITACCKGKRKSAGNYVWRYSEN